MSPGNAVAAVVSTALSLAAVLVIGWTWYDTLRDDPARAYDCETCRVLPGPEAIEDACASAVRPQDSHAGALCIPTGLFLQSIHFETASDVNFTGYLWQKYPCWLANVVGAELTGKIHRGVVFPEEVASGDTNLRESYVEAFGPRGERRDADACTQAQVEDGHLLKGWYFDVTVRETFDYARYPLDSQAVWLRLWPRALEVDDRILLVPDFDAYPLRAGAAGAAGAAVLPERFGLDQDLVPGGWNIEQVLFAHRDVPYDTSFGFPKDDRPDYTELYFTVEMQRQFRNAFIIHLVPLLIVALLLYSQVMMITRDESRAAAFGSDTSGVVATCAALFFVVMLAHIQVRQQFAGSGLVYIELFYLIMYGVIMLTALDAYLFAWRDRALGNEDRWAKLLFWPSTLWAMALASLLQLRWGPV